MPASRIACLESTLSVQRMQALTPEPVYGMPEDLEELLHGAVLAVAAVQGDERDVGADLAQPGDEIVADVDADHRVAEALEGVLDARRRRTATRRVPASARP